MSGIVESTFRTSCIKIMIKVSNRSCYYAMYGAMSVSGWWTLSLLDQCYNALVHYLCAQPFYRYKGVPFSHWTKTAKSEANSPLHNFMVLATGPLNVWEMEAKTATSTLTAFTCSVRSTTGSILRPLLFQLYIIALPCHVEGLSLFADSTALLRLYKSPDRLRDSLRRGINEVHQWVTDYLETTWRLAQGLAEGCEAFIHITVYTD